MSAPPVSSQRFPDGLLGGRWDVSLVMLAALGVSSILYDGLSQSEPFFALFGLPPLGLATPLLAAFMGLVVLLTFAVARRVGVAALGAGLVPIGGGLPHRPLPDLPAG